MTVRILRGDCREVLRALPDESVHCVVTSPPYWGLRDYGMAGQVGVEATYQEFVDGLVATFREARRVLRSDGTLWLNIWDTYAGGGRGGNPGNSPHIKQRTNVGSLSVRDQRGDLSGLKVKDLVGVPWRVAFALQADGWYLRRDIIWHKPNPMPESVRDRPSTAHEYLFLLSKSRTYHYDADAVTEEGSPNSHGASKADAGAKARLTGNHSGPLGIPPADGKRARRSVWTISPEKFMDAHYAVMPNAVAEICIKAGCPAGGTVLDPFGGAGTTALVADRLGLDAILIELNPEYAAMAERRINTEAGMFASAEVIHA